MNGTRALLAVIALAAAHCSYGASTPEEPIVGEPMNPTPPPRTVTEKSYTLGQSMSAHVGEAVARVKQFVVTVEFENSLSFRTPVALAVTGGGLKSALQIPAGTEFPFRGAKYHRRTVYFLTEAIDPELPDVRLMVERGGDYDNLMIDKDGEIYRGCDKPRACVKPNEIKFVPVERKIAKEKIAPFGQNFELVYSGATKDAINLLYREFTADDLARPAFTQNLTYDRTNSTIRFRDMQIRVQEADNESLRYVIEADGLGAE